MSTPFDDETYNDADLQPFAEGAHDAAVPSGARASNTSADTSHLTQAGVLGGVAASFSAAGARAPHKALEESASDKNNIITARGTSEGLVLRIDGRVQPTDLLPAVKDFLASRRSFLAGHDVAFEWIGKKADEDLIANLTSILANEFSITVRSSRLKAPTKLGESTQQAQQPGQQLPQPGLAVLGGGRAGQTNPSASPLPSSVEKTVSLFDGMEGFDAKMSGSAGNSMLWDDPDARVIYGTLRSGQKIETEHSVVVFGDVNSGAEVIAGGDIVILGTLRGIAHAGAYDESGGGRVIFALNLQPTQLRIGLVISRGSTGEIRPGVADRNDKGALLGPEIARVDNNMIVVELYQSRTVWVRRRE